MKKKFILFMIITIFLFSVGMENTNAVTYNGDSDGHGGGVLNSNCVNMAFCRNTNFKAISITLYWISDGEMKRASHTRTIIINDGRGSGYAPKKNCSNIGGKNWCTTKDWFTSSNYGYRSSEISKDLGNALPNNANAASIKKLAKWIAALYGENRNFDNKTKADAQKYVMRKLPYYKQSCVVNRASSKNRCRDGRGYRIVIEPVVGYQKNGKFYTGKLKTVAQMGISSKSESKNPRFSKLMATSFKDVGIDYKNIKKCEYSDLAKKENVNGCGWNIIDVGTAIDTTPKHSCERIGDTTKVYDKCRDINGKETTNKTNCFDEVKIPRTGYNQYKIPKYGNEIFTRAQVDEYLASGCTKKPDIPETDEKHETYTCKIDLENGGWWDLNGQHHDELTKKIAYWIKKGCPQGEREKTQVRCANCTSTDVTGGGFTINESQNWEQILGHYYGENADDEEDLIEKHFLKKSDESGNQVYCSESLQIKLPNERTTQLKTAKPGRYITVNLDTPNNGIMNLTPITTTRTITCKSINNSAVTSDYVNKINAASTVDALSSDESINLLNTYANELNSNFINNNTEQSLDGENYQVTNIDSFVGIKLVYDDETYSLDTNLVPKITGNVKSCNGNTCTLTQKATYELESNIYKYVSAKDGSSKQQEPNESELDKYYNLGVPNLPVRFDDNFNAEVSFVYDYAGTTFEDVFDNPERWVDESSRDCIANIQNKNYYTCPISAEKTGDDECNIECPVGETCCPTGGSAMPCSVNGICPSGGGIKLIYRTIDLANPFPGQSGIGRNTGSNWCDYDAIKGDYHCDNLNDGVGNEKNTSENNTTVSKHIKNNAGASEYEVYRREPQYSITLNSQNINAIREYNKGQKQSGGYDDFTLDCHDVTGENTKTNLYAKGIYTANVCRSNFLRDKNFNFNLTGNCSGDDYDNLLICSERSVSGNE